jgi:FkbM family methyltransferase
MTAELVERCGAGRRVGFIKPDGFAALRDKHADEPGLKVVKCHKLAPEMVAIFERGEALAIHCYRDIRAALVSLMRFRQRSFDDAFPNFVNGYLRHCRMWCDLGEAVMSSRYEDFVEDLEPELRRIADFLGLRPPRKAVRELADELSLPKQRERMEAFRKAKDSGNADASPHDPQSLLHANHISTAVTSEKWRSQLEPAQVVGVEQIAGRWLIEHGYELDNDIDFDFESYAQVGIDCIAWRYFDRRPGIFIEVGAFDGIHLSNTYALEQRGWRGLCIEPHPRYAPMLEANRPTATCIQAAVVGPGHAGNVSFAADELGLFSGLHVDEDDLAARYERRKLHFHGVEQVQVAARTLDEILAEHPPPGPISFVSIDVEGTELEVLRGFDLDVHRPELIVVEVNDEAAATRVAEHFATRSGYVLARQRGVNLFFTRGMEGARRLVGIDPMCTMATQQHPLGREQTVRPRLHAKLDLRFVDAEQRASTAPAGVPEAR